MDSADKSDRRHFDLFVASWFWNFGLWPLAKGAQAPPYLVFPGFGFLGWRVAPLSSQYAFL